MDIPTLQSWNLTPKEASVLRKHLAQTIDVERRLKQGKLIAPADCS